MSLVDCQHSVSLIFSVDFSKVTVFICLLAQWGKHCIRSCFQGAALCYTACGGEPFSICQKRSLKNETTFWACLVFWLLKCVSELAPFRQLSNIPERENCSVSDLRFNGCWNQRHWLNIKNATSDQATLYCTFLYDNIKYWQNKYAFLHGFLSIWYPFCMCHPPQTHLAYT